ncbi:hypothetical protein [Janthinobacterium sp.]|uniref:hypothetical protein n=1 Tax=Janthinobacterium sp. TaxID=1871054 RepID=UPI0026353238|nr:hypothetical protein [Janthinobacterium sp.]
MFRYTVGQKLINQFGTLVIITQLVEPNPRLRMGEWAGVILYHGITRYIGCEYTENYDDRARWVVLDDKQKLVSPIKLQVGDLVEDDYFLRGTMMIYAIRDGVVYTVNTHNGETFEYNPECLVRVESVEVGN